MSPLDPAQAEQLASLRGSMRRALGRGRWWYLRGVVMMMIAVMAGYMGGQVYRFLAVVLVLLAAMSISLGRSIRRGAKDALKKIDLMEHDGGGREQRLSAADPKR